MGKKLALLISAMICFYGLVPYATAETEEIERSLPDSFPNTYLGYYWIGGHDTNGATFVITEASVSDQEIHIQVLQLPNDNDTLLIDNQTEYPSNDCLYQDEIATASQKGKKLIGTLCDIEKITDEDDHVLPLEYAVQFTRSGSSLSTGFTIYLPQTLHAKSLYVTICFGVNEALDAHFFMQDSITVEVPL